MGILKKEEPADPVYQDDGEQQDEAGIDTGPVREAEIRRAKKKLRKRKSPW